MLDLIVNISLIYLILICTLILWDIVIGLIKVFELKHLFEGKCHDFYFNAVRFLCGPQKRRLDEALLKLENIIERPLNIENRVYFTVGLTRVAHFAFAITELKTVYLQKKFIDKLSDIELLSVLAHEVGHILYRHYDHYIGNELEADNFASSAVGIEIYYLFLMKTINMPEVKSIMDAGGRRELTWRIAVISDKKYNQNI